MNAIDAEYYCLSSYNTHLATILSMNDNEEAFFTCNSTNNCWIGLYKIDYDWKWRSNNSINYINWNNNSNNEENCTEIFGSLESNSDEWNKRNCDDFLPFLCDSVLVLTQSPTLVPTQQPTKICGDNQYVCSDRNGTISIKSEEQCLHTSFMCDDVPDCPLGDDEYNCPNCENNGGFICNDGTCINKNYKCDNFIDCPDGSDESLLTCSIIPTFGPTKQPTTNPTLNPLIQSKIPSRLPTFVPTKNPTPAPTRNPTPSPTKRPTKQPTNDPTQQPNDEN